MLPNTKNPDRRQRELVRNFPFILFHPIPGDSGGLLFPRLTGDGGDALFTLLQVVVEGHGGTDGGGEGTGVVGG